MNHGFKHTVSTKDSFTNYCVLLITAIIVSRYNVNKISKCFFIKHTIYPQKVSISVQILLWATVVTRAEKWKFSF